MRHFRFYFATCNLDSLARRYDSILLDISFMYAGLGWTPLAIFFRASLLTLPRVFMILKLSWADTNPLLKSTEMSKATDNFVLTNPVIKQHWTTTVRNPRVPYPEWRCCPSPQTGSISHWPTSRPWWRWWRAPRRSRRWWGRRWDCRCWGSEMTGWSRGTSSTRRTELKWGEM